MSHEIFLVHALAPLVQILVLSLGMGALCHVTPLPPHHHAIIIHGKNNSCIK